jgi:enoyl-[acyl-carrier-protein] reductase (NADH)
MNDFAGKCGLIVGVANKYSIAWAIAQAVARRGAKLALTYQGRFEDHVKKLSAELPEGRDRLRQLRPRSVGLARRGAGAPGSRLGSWQ